MGIIAQVYRSCLDDHSNGGLSSKFHEVEIVNDEPPSSTRSKEHPPVLLVLGSNGPKAVLALSEDGRRWDPAAYQYTHGGTYIGSDDPRFAQLVTKLLGYWMDGAIRFYDREEPGDPEVWRQINEGP